MGEGGQGEWWHGVEVRIWIERGTDVERLMSSEWVGGFDGFGE